MSDPQAHSRRTDVLLFLVGLAGTGLSLSGAVGTLVLTVLSLLQGDPEAAAFGAWASGAMAAMSACGIPAVWLGLRGMLGNRPDAPLRPHRSWLALVLLFPAALYLGTLVLPHPNLTLLAIPVHIATAVLPVITAVLLVRVPGPALTRRRTWGQFLTGLWAMPPLAMLLEVLVLVPLVAVVVVALSRSSDALQFLEPLLPGSGLAVPSMEESAVRLLLHPWVIAGVFAFVAGLVPLIEEAVKSLAVLPLARRLSPAHAFVGGAIGGAGYALFEALFLTQPDPSWLTTMVGRGGATLMHAFTAALTSWGISQVVHHRRWGRLLLGYGLAAAMHALWNATAVGVGLVQVRQELGSAPLSATLTFAVQAGPFFLAALSLVALVGLPLGASRLTHQPLLLTGATSLPEKYSGRGRIAESAARPPERRARMPMPRVGDLAPDFSLLDDRGALVRLSGLRGRPIVLYFYPKDDTPGCTAEACGFRDRYADYEQNAIVVLGISPDPVASHSEFREKFSLPFPLLADADHAVASAYGVWGPKSFMGRSFEGVLRTTFLIGPDGRLLRIYENVKPAGHSQQILADLIGTGSPS